MSCDGWNKADSWRAKAAFTVAGKEVRKGEEGGVLEVDQAKHSLMAYSYLTGETYNFEHDQIHLIQKKKIWKVKTVTWASLRTVGNLKFLKVSYIILAVIPFLSHYDNLVSFLGVKPWFLAAVFFGTLFLALANLIYDAECPAVIKRFESPNDLYREMLLIRDKSVLLYPNDNFDGSLEHCKRAYRRFSAAHPSWRQICMILYVTASILFAIVFTYRALSVLDLFVRGFGAKPHEMQVNDFPINLHALAGNGRIYTITVTWTDSSGNSNSTTATVTVPKSQNVGQ